MTQRWIVLVVLLWLAVVELRAATTVFFDTCTVGADTDLASHTPDTGTSWTELIDSVGTVTMQCANTGDAIKANTAGAQTSHGIAYQAAPAAASSAYDVIFDYTTFTGSADDGVGVLFGIQDSDDFCGLILYDGALANPDVVLFQQIAGTRSDFASGTANTGHVAGTTWTVQVRGTSITVLEGVTPVFSGLTGTTCDDALPVGIFMGNLRTATDDYGSAGRLDNVTIVDQTAGTPAPKRLLMGVGERLYASAR